MKRLWLLSCAFAVAVAGCRGGSASSALPQTPAVPADGTLASAPASNHAAPLLLVEPAKVGATVSSLVLGANMASWYDITQSGISASFKTAGMTATRWPGGSESDDFHWQNNSLGAGKCGGGYVYPASTVDNFVADVAHGANLDLAFTVNYGSNAACTAGADPSEAAAWVAYANNTKHYNVKWWSVGNEEFGSWETDIHSKPHDPGQYAGNVASGFYPAMKAASKTPINVCVDVEPGWYTGWDPVVLAQAKYDCVELHYYPESPGKETDSFLIGQAAKGLTTSINALKKELQTAGHPKTPIYVGEIGSVYATPGKQSMSITQALYAGQVIGEMLNDGVARATWWLGFGGCETDGNFSSSLYGWQNYGGYMLFSDGQSPYECNDLPIPPRGTPLPTARAFQVASHFVRNGEHMLGLTQTSLPNVRAYASTYNGGYAVMLFNLSETAAVSVPVRISGKSSGTGGTIVTYDRALYDKSKSSVWSGPVTTKLGAWNGSFTVALPPWSMASVVTQ